MLALAKLSLVATVALAAVAMLPLFSLLAAPLAVLASLPLWWYLAFTRPARVEAFRELVAGAVKPDDARPRRLVS